MHGQLLKRRHLSYARRSRAGPLPHPTRRLPRRGWRRVFWVHLLAMSIASSGALLAALRAAPGELAPGAADDSFAPPVQPKTGFLAQLSAKASSALEVLGNSVPKRATGAGWNSIRMLIIYLSIYTATQGVFDGWECVAWVMRGGKRRRSVSRRIQRAPV